MPKMMTLVRIAVTAPTGKAAQRLTESIQSRASFFHLPEAIQSQLSELQGLTLHSLLGIAPDDVPSIIEQTLYLMMWLLLMNVLWSICGYYRTY